MSKFFDIFRRGKNKSTQNSTILSVGGGLSFFTENQKTINSTYRNCVDCFSRHISKIKPRVLLNGEESDRRAQRNYIIGLRPNPAQTASEFYRVLASDYCNGLALAHIERDSQFNLQALIPVNASNISIYRSPNNERIVKSYSIDGNEISDYLDNFICIIKKSNSENPLLVIDHSLDQILNAVNASNESFAKAAIKSHIIKYICTTTNPTGPKLVTKDIEEQLENTASGIIQLPALANLQPVNQSQAVYARSAELDDFLAEIYSYFGFSKTFARGNFTEDQFQAVYESALEPFINDLAQEMTYKLLTRKEIGFGNRVEIMSDPLQTASMNTRIKLASTLQSCATYRPNDIRRLLYQEPIEGGDKAVQNLTFVNKDKADQADNAGTDDSEQQEPVEKDPTVDDKEEKENE